MAGAAVEAEHLQIAKKQDPDPAPAAPAADAVLKCPKCQGTLESGYIKEEASGDSGIPFPADWIKGYLKKGFIVGTVVTERRHMDAYRCTNCGYVELYAR
jgi:predicted nucleic-acid-binding Zn-ribbon protein